jgi:hypothetical protein
MLKSFSGFVEVIATVDGWLIVAFGFGPISTGRRMASAPFKDQSNRLLVRRPDAITRWQAKCFTENRFSVECPQKIFD